MRSSEKHLFQLKNHLAMKITKINQNGIDLITQWEGLKLSPYLCSAGVPTIGYGSTRYE